MNRLRLESKLRNVGVAYLLFFIAGAHYAYLNKWGIQILYWITFGGLGIWWLIDLFRLPGMVYDFNEPIFDEIEWIEKEERDRENFLELDKSYMKRKEQILNYRF